MNAPITLHVARCAKGPNFLTSEGQVFLRQWADFTRQFCVRITHLRNEFVLGRGEPPLPQIIQKDLEADKTSASFVRQQSLITNITLIVATKYSVACIKNYKSREGLVQNNSEPFRL